ncbi:MAG: hypothetical protein MUC43_08960 [Pirellula sp.]|jgi:hypothetical protein|nr:hypothetical protein [Pirellula sp.]
MSRSASILGNVFWIALTIATLLYPCLPARDPNGEFFALSRFDFALIYLASPEALWLQWTAGLPLDFWPVRGGAVATAMVWLVALSFAGALFLGGRRQSCSLGNEGWVAFWSMRLVFGFSILHGICLLHAPLPVNVFAYVTVGLMVAMPLAIYLWRTKFRRLQRQESSSSHKAIAEEVVDKSLDQPWKRRLYGLATIACILLVAVHMVGSMVPSVDRQVRNQKWVNTTHAYEHLAAPNIDGFVDDGSFNAKRELGIGQIDPIAYLSMALMQHEVRHGKLKQNAPSQSLGVSPVYQSLLASKLVHIIVGIAGFLIVWGRAIEWYGRGPATMMLMLVLATPALLELGRLGRVEWIVTSQFAVIISLLNGRREELGRMAWFQVVVIALPMLEWLLSLIAPTTLSPSEKWGAALRFMGLSSLFAAPWVACWVIGVFTKREAKQFAFVGSGIGIFVLLSWIGNAPDRSWIPALGLFVLSVAGGIKWLLEHQIRFIGLIAWCGVMVVSLVNAAYWPTMENRIFAPIEWLVLEHWSEYGETQGDMRSQYPLEFRAQLREGKLQVDSKVLLIGTRDDLDVPIDCITMEPNPSIDQESIATWIQQFGVTHIGIVSGQVLGDMDSIAQDEAVEKAIREILERMVEQGALQKQPVSAECFDLTLFKVHR